jgi:A/G-specific adenine glycosylase
MARFSRATDARVGPAADDAAWKRHFRRRLLAWFAIHQRELPWRRSCDPYGVWISEIMLQQTQVATVIPYYERFLAAFPDVHALAAAPEHDVLKLWEGLGYYRRARQLHRAARVLVATHGGTFPRDLAAVRELPGIGRYTAGAIVSIAFDLPAPILEANTVRLLSRLLAFQGDPASTAGQRLLWQAAESLLPRKQAGAFNQALMELGSLVCTPRAPGCDGCPAQLLCGARLQGLVEELPRLRAKAPSTPVREAAIVIRRGGQVFIRRRTEGERWAGLWDFPRFAIASQHEGDLSEELVARTRELTGMTILPGDRLATLKHGVTRFRITLECFAAKVVAGRPKKSLPEQCDWVQPAELANYPLSTTGRKISRLLET